MSSSTTHDGDEARSDPADFDTVPPLDSGPGRVERSMRAVVLLGMLVVAILAVTNRLGLRTDVVSADGGGMRLEVEYPAVTRPGVPSALSIEVTSLDGEELPAEVIVRITSEYLSLFDQAQPSPQPSQATATSEDTEWTFDVAPGARTMTATIEARLHPSLQRSRSARIAVIDGGTEAVAVELDTTVVP